MRACFSIWSYKKLYHIIPSGYRHEPALVDTVLPEAFIEELADHERLVVTLGGVLKPFEHIFKVAVTRRIVEERDYRQAKRHELVLPATGADLVAHYAIAERIFAALKIEVVSCLDGVRVLSFHGSPRITAIIKSQRSASLFIPQKPQF